MRTNLTRGIALALAALMLLSVFAAPGAALDDTTIAYDTTADSEGDLAGDGTDMIEQFNASDEETTTLATEIDTSTTDPLSSIEIEITHDREGAEDATTHFTYDVAEEDILDETTDWVSVDHEGAVVEIDHDELDSVPVTANEEEAISVNVTFVAGDDDEIATDEFEMTLDATDERTVVYVDEDASEDSDIGAEVTEETEEAGILGSLPLMDADDETVYDINTERNVAGDNTTVEMQMADSDIAEAFEDGAVDQSSEDLIAGQTVLVDGTPALVFYDEANTDLVDEDEDTYAVYDSDAEALHLELGENDYDGEETVEMTSVSNNALTLDDVSLDELPNDYAEELGFGGMLSEFGIGPAASSLIGDIGEDNSFYAVFALALPAGALRAHRAGGA